MDFASRTVRVRRVGDHHLPALLLLIFAAEQRVTKEPLPSVMS